MSVQLKGRARTAQRSIVSLIASLAVLLGFVAMQGVNASSASAAGEQAVVAMPFDGKWAYNAAVAPSNSSHPSVHHTPGGGDWGTDLYAGSDGTQVRLKVNYPGSNVSFSKIASSTSCGQSLRLNIVVNGVTVGWVYYAHMSNVTGATSFTNGMVIGTVNNLGCNPGRHIHVEFKNTQGNHSCYVGDYNVGGSLGYGANLGVLGSGNSGVRQACTSIPSGSVDDDISHPSNANLLLARQGSNLYGKADLGAAWTHLASNATGGMWASGNRIAYLSNGTLYAKNGLGGAWLTEATNVNEVALSADILAIRSGSMIYAKGGLDSAWVTIANDAIDLKVAGTKIFHRNAAHTLFSNNGLYGAWYNEGANVDQFDASGNIIVKRSGNNAYAKYHLGDAWIEISDVASDVQVGGSRIAVISTADGHVWAKNWIGGTWANEEDAGDDYILTPSLLLIRQGNKVIGKSGLGDAWVVLATTSTHMEVAGSRIAVINASGDLAARNDLPTGWYNVLDSVTEFTVGS